MLVVLCGLCASPAHAGVQEQARADKAVHVLQQIMQAPDRGIPSRLVRDAYAIAVIPGVIKAGFVIGGRHGEGLLSIRNNGVWSNPIFLRMNGGSIGFQAGVQSTDVVLVFRTRRSVDSIVYGKFTLGADASVAAGPVGRAANAATDAQMRAEIYSYSRNRGLFAGVALDGSVLSIDAAANAAVYGDDATPQRIFSGAVRGVPNEVVDFRDRLEEYTAR